MAHSAMSKIAIINLIVFIEGKAVHILAKLRTANSLFIPFAPSVCVLYDTSIA